MIANKQKSDDKEKSVCNYNDFSRPKYFHGMLLQDTDFRAEQEYHAQKRRFLNRMLHGSGVVCGLDLIGKKEGRSIEVTSGFALDCSGNEIWVPHPVTVDLEKLLPPKDKGKNQAECVEPDDQEANTYYIGIRYEEKPSNPISVHLPSGSCEERTCENSRVKEGFCIEIVPCCLKKPDKTKYPGLLNTLCKCPEKFEVKEEEMPLCPSCQGLENRDLCRCLRMEEFCEQSVPCPECCSCDTPCHVVLGKITVDEDRRLVNLCINDCRSYVLTGGLLRHMITGVFAQEGYKYFEMSVDGKDEPLPKDLLDWVYNPIKGLCWWLPKKLEGGEFNWLGCNQGEQSQRSKAQQQFKKEVREELKTELLAEIRQQVGIAIKNIEPAAKPREIQPTPVEAAAKEKEPEKPTPGKKDSQK